MSETSTTSTPFQPIAHLVGFTELAHRLMTSDLKAIPAERQNALCGGCARTPLNIVAECGLTNRFIAAYLFGEAPNRVPPEQRTAFLDSFDTEEKALLFLDEHTMRLLDAIRALDVSTLGDTSDNVVGRPMSRFAIAELPAAHMMYHDGQLGYFQTLHGDGESHWG